MRHSLVRRFFPTLCSLLLLTTLAGAAAAQDGGPPGALRGRVTVAGSGAPLTGATVLVVGTRLQATTGGDGGYEIRAVPAGDWTLRVRRIGYEATTRRVTVGTEAVSADFALTSVPTQLAEVQIVGSRAQHTAAEELAVPVDVYTSETIRRQGTTETSQVLQQLAPSVNFPRQSVTDADDIVRPFTLRGLSPDHTLVLVNGLRRHRTSLVHIFAYGMGAGSSGVDLNALPASAIEQIEVLREGAAAQYGSDAIAGVVNVRLKSGAFRPYLTTETGAYFTGEQDYPVDGEMLTAGGGWGFNVGRGSIALFGEYRNRQPTNRAGGDNSDQIVEGDADEVDPVTGEIIDKNNDVPMPNHHWGDGLAKDALGFVNARLPLGTGGTAELYAFGGYGYRRGEGQGFRRQGVSERNWQNIYPQGYLPIFNGKTRDASGSAGFRGTVAGWSYDLGATYGHNRFRYDLDSTMNVSLGPCLDAPCAPGADGVLGTADDPGIANKTSIYAGTLKADEFDVSADVVRPLAIGGLASPLNVAAGVSFRRERYRIIAGERASYIQGFHPDRNGDPAPPGSQVFAGFQPSNETDESRNNVGGYLDLETSIVPQLLANVAGRVEHYTDFGEKVTGKLALRFQPAPQFVLRGGVSTGFRAPNLAQSHYASSITNFELDEATGRQRPVEVGIFPVESRPAQLLGAQPLKPETSVNLNAGFAVTPVSAFTLTADAYWIRIEDRIILTASIGGDVVAERLAAEGLSVTAAQYFTNALTTRTTGIDLTATYRVPAGATARVDLVGSFNYTKNKVLEIVEPPELEGTGAVLFDSVASGGLISLESERPKARGTLQANYVGERLHGLVRGSYWGEFTSAQIGACGDCIQTYGAKTLLDAEIGYKVHDLLDVSLGARNLLDTYPDRPSTDNSFGIMVWPAASPFGYNGRFVYARVEVGLGE